MEAQSAAAEAAMLAAVPVPGMEQTADEINAEGAQPGSSSSIIAG